MFFKVNELMELINFKFQSFKTSNNFDKLLDGNNKLECILQFYIFIIILTRLIHKHGSKIYRNIQVILNTLVRMDTIKKHFFYVM